MTRGTARRVTITDAEHLAEVIDGLGSAQAIALGTFRAGLSDDVSVVTKRQLNGEAPNVIARTGTDIVYREGQTAFVLLDYDTKAMPVAVAEAIERHGGFWPAVCAVCPALATATRVTRGSTSSGLSRSDTGAAVPGSDGTHVFVVARDGSDADRFLQALHDRCWLNGLGWIMIGTAGQFLERSIVDRMVGAAERLVFEGPPILEPPLVQDRAARRAIVIPGEALDTLAACPPLSIVETARVNELKAKEKQRLASEAAKVRTAYEAEQAQKMIARGVPADQAARAAKKWCDGVLLSDVVLPFADDELSGVTVADMLRNPDQFDGITLADPIEGIENGVMAKVMRGYGGSVIIHSFSHGGMIYQLKYDAAAVQAAIDAAAEDDAVDTFIKFALLADLSLIEEEKLIKLVAERSDVPKQALKQTLKAARKEHAAKRAAEARRHRAAENPQSLSLADFYTHLPSHSYIFTPTREFWPASSVNVYLPPVPIPGSDEVLNPATWLDQNQAVEQMTWAPGLPMLIENRLVAKGGWIKRDGVTCFNLYIPPTIELGDPNDVEMWLTHIKTGIPRRRRPHHHVVRASAAEARRKDQSRAFPRRWGGYRQGHHSRTGEACGWAVEFFRNIGEEDARPVQRTCQECDPSRRRGARPRRHQQI
jgi:hypothetical protein